MIQIPYMDLILVSRHLGHIKRERERERERRLSRVCLAEMNIFATIFFFVCVLEIKSRMDR